MAEITAAMVKELREATGLGMMECKKALTEADGDIKKAEEILRIKSGAKASKVAGRVAAEGVIAAYVGADGRAGALAEVNCETDFVAKDAAFAQFARAVAQVAADKGISEPEVLSQEQLPSGETVEAARHALVSKLGENMNLRRLATVKAQGRLASYLHGTRIGVLVDYSGGDDTLGKDLAMHIAASKPVARSRDEVPAELIERERTIARARAVESGRPENLLDKIVEGAVNKYLSEVTLLGQPFVKDDKQTVEKLLKANGATVHAFHMFVLGEGIEKKKSDFVAEVMAAASQA
ncbi:MAG: elongation factor Ts [Betaproteobacteria bacterium]|nr:elongation factor Ts [Betaproteobacteria bacterium]